MNGSLPLQSTPYDPDAGLLPDALVTPAVGPLLLLTAPDTRESGWAARAAVELAAAWAADGRDVVLVDLDAEQPRLHQLVGIENGEGATDMLEFGASLDQVARPTARGFRLIPTGAYVADPENFLRADAWARVGAEAGSTQTMLLLYAPADGPGSGTLASRLGSVVMLGFLEPRMPPLPRAILVPAEAPAERVWDTAEQPDGEPGEPWSSAPGRGIAEETYPPEPPRTGAVPEPHPTTPIAAPPLYAGSDTADRASGEEGRWPATDGESTGTADLVGGIRASDVTEPPAPEADAAAPDHGAALPEPVAPLPLPEALREPEPEPQPEPSAPAPVPGEAAPPRPAPPEPHRLRLKRHTLSAEPAWTGGISEDKLLAEPPVLVTGKRRKKDRLERRPLTLVLYAILLGVLAYGAFEAGRWYLAERVAGSTGSTAQRVPGPGPREVTPAAPGAIAPPLGEPGDEGNVPLPYSVAIEAHQSRETAMQRAAAVARREPDLGVYVSPILVDTTVYYRVLAGPVADTAAAMQLNRRLVERGHKTDADAWAVRRTQFAYALGTYPTREAAAARAGEVAGKGILAYAVPIASGDTVPQWRLYAGAFEGRGEATVMQPMLQRAGIDAPLVQRTGRPPE